MTSNVSAFAQFIATRRSALGLTQDALAAKAGLRSSEILSWESARCKPGFTNSSALTLLAEGLDVEVGELLATLDPLERCCYAWSHVHGRVLEAELLGRDVALHWTNTDLPVALATIRRWVRATTKPQPGTLRALLEGYEIPLDTLLAVGDTPAETETNRFAAALVELRHDLGMSTASFAEALNIPKPTLAAWLSGRQFPAGELRTRLEYALGVSIDEVHREAELAELAQRDLAGLPVLAGVLIRRRQEMGWTRADVLERTGLGEGVISRAESVELGENPQFRTLRQIASGYDLPFDEVAWAVFGVPGENAAFHERLRNLRLSRLLSSNEVGAALGVHHFIYTRYESGEHFPQYNSGRLAGLAEVFGVSLETLLRTGANPELFADWLHTRCTEKAISHLELATALGVDVEDVEDWLTGSSQPTFRDVSPIAGLFRVNRAEVRAYLMAS